MRQVNMHDAKTHLSALIKATVCGGEPFVIAVAGKPQVKVVPLNGRPSAPRIGFLKGYGKVPDDFNSMGRDEIPGMFEGMS